MTRGSHRGAPPSAKARGKQPAGRKSDAWTPTASASNKRRRSTSCDNDDSGEDVTLVYQRPSRRQVRGGVSVRPVADRVTTVGKRNDGFGAGSSSARSVAVPSVRGGHSTLNSGDADALQQLSRRPASGPQHRSQQMRLGENSTPAEVLLWRRCLSQRNLLRSVENCGLAPASWQEGDGKSGGKGAQAGGGALVETLFALSEDRIRTAIQSLVDLQALALYVPAREARAALRLMTPGSAANATRKGKTAGTVPAASQPTLMAGGWWVEKAFFGAAVALARLCDAAVPTIFPSLVTADAGTLAGFEHSLAVQDSSNGDSGHSSTSPHEAKEGKTLTIVPLPVSMLAVRERLRSLMRLWQIRFTYGLFAPVLHRCQTVAELNDFFLPRDMVAPQRSPSGAPPTVPLPVSDGDTFAAFPSLTSACHRAEGLVLGELLGCATAMCKLDAASWSPLATLAALKAASCVYIVQHSSRQSALAELLAEEADLYGLPPFLRSIRRTAFSLAGAGMGTAGGAAASAPRGRRAIGPSGSGAVDYSKEYLLFPSLCSLDVNRFVPPDAMQTPLVQEELIALALKHCAFGMLVGEADQVVTVLKEWSEHRVECQQRQQKDAAKLAALKREADDLTGSEFASDELVKREKVNAEEANGGEGSECGARRLNRRRRDPMLPFARETALRAREIRRSASLAAVNGGSSGKSISGNNGAGEAASLWRSMCHVDWLCDNRWAPSETNASYYGLVYGVVLKSELLATLEGATPGAPLDADGAEGGSDESGKFREVTYYLSAVVELTR